MNEINANKRLKEAAAEKAEADKILVVKVAVSRYLSQSRISLSCNSFSQHESAFFVLILAGS